MFCSVDIIISMSVYVCMCLCVHVCVCLRSPTIGAIDEGMSDKAGYTWSPSLFLPAKKSGYILKDIRTNGQTDRRIDSPSYKVAAHNQKPD